jgi:hypothetical protein
MISMSAAHSAIIPAGNARPISNGSLMADCPFHETGEHMLRLLSRAADDAPVFLLLRLRRTRAVHRERGRFLYLARAELTPA